MTDIFLPGASSYHLTILNGEPYDVTLIILRMLLFFINHEFYKSGITHYNLTVQPKNINRTRTNESDTNKTIDWRTAFLKGKNKSIYIMAYLTRTTRTVS